jgi:hypothetical protein
MCVFSIVIPPPALSHWIQYTVLPPCESTRHAGKKSLPSEVNYAYRTEKKVLTVQKKFCLLREEKSAYRVRKKLLTT